MPTLRLCLPLLLCACGISFAQNSWEEKAWVALNKKITAEFVDSKLSETISFMSSLTHLTIILDPKVAKNDPVVSLKVHDMDAGTVIKWITKLTETYAEIKDDAIYITDKPSEASVEDEKTSLAIYAAVHKVEIDLPPLGVALTDPDRVKIALKLMEKEEYKPTDFPGPEFGLGPKENTPANPFGPPATK